MYLSRLMINRSRVALKWVSNPYRVHQRLLLACEGDPRLLFRIDELEAETLILAQSHNEPDLEAAFGDFQVLRCPPECKSFALNFAPNTPYRFRLRANPTVKRDGKRLGLFKEVDQRAWLARKLEAAGAELLGCRVAAHGWQRSHKNPRKDAAVQSHYAVLYEGILRARDPVQLQTAVANGIGPAKAYGFGLLSLASMTA